MKLILSPDPAALWGDFVGQVGPEIVAKAYRTSRGFPVHGERVWEAWYQGALVGWGSLIEDPMSWNLVYRLGVFPGHTGQSVRSRIHWALAAEAFSEPRVMAMSGAVLLSNPHGQVERIQKSAENGTWAPITGMHWAPAPGMIVFTVTRQFYELRMLGGDDLLPEVGG